MIYLPMVISIIVSYYWHFLYGFWLNLPNYKIRTPAAFNAFTFFLAQNDSPLAQVSKQKDTPSEGEDDEKSEHQALDDY